jgi:hypothetical protein
MPITLIASLIDPHALEPLEPSGERRSFFHSITGIGYSPPVTPDLTSVRNIQCPICVRHTRLSTYYWNATRTGWAQPNFKSYCYVCDQTFTKENMGIRKFCDELASKRAGRRIFFSYESFTASDAPSYPPLTVKLCSTRILEWRMSPLPRNICKVL